MERIEELDRLLKRLKRLEQGKEVFSSTFREIYFALDWDKDRAAEVLDTSKPIITRWLSGKSTPPALNLVIKFLREEIIKKIYLEDKELPDDDVCVWLLEDEGDTYRAAKGDGGDWGVRVYLRRLSSLRRVFSSK